MPMSTVEVTWDFLRDKVLGDHLSKSFCLQRGLNPADSSLTFHLREQNWYVLCMDEL